MHRNQLRRSRPLLASISKFHQLPLDPGQIHQDLKRIYIDAGDPRKQMHAWFRLLDEYDVTHLHAVDYRFMITFKHRTDSRVGNRGEASILLQEEKEKWKMSQQLCFKRGVPYGDDGQPIPSAFGFWLFPIEAFGAIPSVASKEPENGAVIFDSDLEREWDLSRYKPKLCLQDLPETLCCGFDIPKGLESQDESQEQKPPTASPSKEFYPLNSHMRSALGQRKGS